MVRRELSAPLESASYNLAIDTLPKLLARNAADYPGEIALREKKFGIWHTYTWLGYQTSVRRRALGMRAIGVQRGDVVGLIGNNRPDWVFGEVAAHALGAISLGIYRDALDEEVAFLANHSGARVIFAEDEEQVDKLLALGERIPGVHRIIYCDPRGMRKYSDPRLTSISELDALGDDLASQQPALYAELVRGGSGQDVAILCTTSGTTSNPKLAMLSAERLIRHCRKYLLVDPKGPDDEYVSVLPLPWIMEQVYTLGEALVSRMRINFVEEPETAMADMRELGPTFVLFAPRLWEQIAADVRARALDASPLKRLAFHVGMKLAMAASTRQTGSRSTLADFLLFRALRDRLGFSRLRSAATGGAALGPDTFRFFKALGVPLRQLYGQTELIGAYTIHRVDDVDLETVGVPFDDVQVVIENADASGVGEIVTRHPNMFLGYFKNDAATRAVLREDGWMTTGDAGYFDNKGHLVVIDRIQDLSVTSEGFRFSPQYVENKLKFSPYVAEAVVLGDRRPYLAALVCIRFSIVAKWAEKKRIAFTTYTDLSARPEIYDLLTTEVERINATLPAPQRIRKLLLLYKELDADDGELTRTRKVRRGVIGEKYGDIIEALYANRSEIEIDTTVAFQDGSKQRIQTRLRIVDLHSNDDVSEKSGIGQRKARSQNPGPQWM
jgi:long-chain acyl-CoA synthetase